MTRQEKELEDVDLEKREPSGSVSHEEHHSDDLSALRASEAQSDLHGRNNLASIQEGTFHQSQITQRQGFFKHLFLPLDRAYMDAVHRDAEGVVYEDGGEEERRIKKKVDNRILPLIILSYLFNQFDRTNIGNAHVIPEFNENFGITNNNKWTLALSIFYVGYCLLEMPANVLQRYIGANRFFFITFTFWGLSSLSIVYAKGYGTLLALRILLGIGEAGFYAGTIYYLSFWYKRRELAMRISLCMTGTVPGAIGGLLAFGLVRAHTSVLTGWQFLFLIESIPTITMGFLILFLLPSFPFSASFLTSREKAILQARLNRDHRPQSHGGMNGWEGFKAVISDVNAWGFMLIYASFNVGVATISYFLPTLINELGFSSVDAQGLTVAPYVVGFFMVVIQSWHSDKTRTRGWHIMLSSSVSCIGYIILTCLAGEAPGVARGKAKVGASYFALFLVISGNYSLFPLIMSWAANNLSPTSKRGVGTAFVVSVSNTVSIASPQIYFDPEDSFRKGHAIAAGSVAALHCHSSCLFLAFLIAFALRTRLAILNRRNQRILREMSKKDGDDSPTVMSAGKSGKPGGEIYDTDPRFVFTT